MILLESILVLIIISAETTVLSLCTQNHILNEYLAARYNIICNISHKTSLLSNILRPRQNVRHFPDDIFKCISWKKIYAFRLKISLMFVSKGPVNNILVLVQIMIWRRLGDKPLSEPILVRLLTQICVTRPQWDNIWHVISSPLVPWGFSWVTYYYYPRFMTGSWYGSAFCISGHFLNESSELWRFGVHVTLKYCISIISQHEQCMKI